MLFNLVADTLQSFLNNAQPLFSGPLAMPPKAVQFADDTVIIAEAYPKNIKLISQILQHFANISGLKINDQKSVFVPISIRTDRISLFQTILRCENSHFPINYLGLPLSTKKLRRVHFLPLIEALQRRMQGWQSKVLSLAGRLTLVKVVLSSIPLHFLQAIRLPRWVIGEVDKLRRNFLWRGSDKHTGGYCLANWNICSLPKKNGGLGIIDLTVQNDALLTKWLWKLASEPNSMWTKTILDIYGSTDPSILASSSRLSHTFKELLHLTHFFKVSIHNNDTTHQLEWRWTNDRAFSAKSAYSSLRNPGCISSNYKDLWMAKAPPKVKLFLWLALRNRILTRDNLIKRGCSASPNCALCQPTQPETVPHLLMHCSFSRLVYSLVNSTILPPSHTISLQEHWTIARKTQPQNAETTWLAIIWNTWKERNRVVFQDATPSAH